MCELLGMSANVPTDICFSFTGLMLRAARPVPTKDGWGSPSMRGQGFRTFRIPNSAQSPIAKAGPGTAIKSRAVVSHIRWCEPGCVSLETPTPLPANCGAVTGPLPTMAQLTGYKRLPTGRHRPVGDTDSEHAFCWLLDRLEHKYPKRPANFPPCSATSRPLCDELRGLRVFNILLSDGEFVMTYCSNNLYWLTRRAPFGEARLLDEGCGHRLSE